MFGSRERYRSGYNGADSKSVGQGNLAHGFESHPLHQYINIINKLYTLFIITQQPNQHPQNSTFLD